MKPFPFDLDQDDEDRAKAERTKTIRRVNLVFVLTVLGSGMVAIYFLWKVLFK